MGVAESHEARTFGIFHHAALERDGAQFVGLSAARPHVLILWSGGSGDLGIVAISDRFDFGSPRFGLGATGPESLMIERAL
jgi:hypothetical protein